MLKRICLLSFAVLFANSVFSQSKKLTMEDAIVNVRTTLAPKKLSQLNWIKGTDKFFYVDNSSKNEALVIGSSSAPEKKVIELSEINNELTKNKIDSLAKFPTVNWKNESQFYFRVKNNEYICNLEKKQVYFNRTLNLSDKAENNDENSSTGKIAFSVDNGLYVYDGQNTMTIGTDENKNIVYGRSVHRDEFGITKGTFWSEQGNKLAFYRMDQTRVTDYPIIDFTQQPAIATNIKYPMAGATSHFVTVGIYDVNTKKTIYLQTGEPKDQYLTNIAWSPDEKKIYLAVLNREQNHMKLNCYNAETGEFEKTLFEEKDDKYVEPLNPVQFVKNNSSQFIWQSNRDGFNHIYLYDVSGKLIKQLTKGEWEVTEVKGFDKQGKRIYFTCNMSSPINRDLCSVTLSDAKIKRITLNNGTNASILNSETDEFINTFSSTEVPRNISVINADGKELKQLLNSANPLKDFKLGGMKIFSIRNKANTNLYCRMFFPPDMDSTKKYPVINYVYGGSHVQLITNTWLAGQGDAWFYYLAQEGFIVFTLDNRGSDNRGRAFEQATFRNLGDAEMEDQLSGLDYLKSLKYVDAGRIGVDGWSYGGFMTMSLMTRHPGLFKVAVAGGPVIDWSYYEVMYTERYMDTPQTNADGYKKSSLFNYVENLKGKMMLIHGTSDNVVVWQHSISYLKKCIEKNIQVDYFVYPGYEHNVRGKDRVHLMNKITDYFKENL
ncbi:MAG TPA: DPP IV N-terminal domain-containing protein [Bacteroidia bacterium]|nr:DPP IV N-terminal domain-containing protein [Bacteroidia bacterium]